MPLDATIAETQANYARVEIERIEKLIARLSKQREGLDKAIERERAQIEKLNTVFKPRELATPTQGISAGLLVNVPAWAKVGAAPVKPALPSR